MNHDKNYHDCVWGDTSMKTENKQVTESLLEAHDGQLQEIASAEKDILEYCRTRLEKLQGNLTIPLNQVDTKALVGSIEDLLTDELHPIEKELNNRLEDL